jgi:CheY-like chemotaxis protein
VLPRLEGAAGSAASDWPGAGGERAQAGLRILVVEDHADSAEMLAFLLRLEGTRSASRATASGALDAARAQRPDVVLCDIGLPG